MIVLGVILALIGYLLGVPFVGPIGIILVVVGLLLWLLGSTGRPVGGRRYWW
ncbi:hypothetical protein SEA_LEOPARD_6 [Mycobacterium phage Leopard]|uniref:Membrane protein n=1 Tax=Mycobacterium phage Onyinye TaxID=2686235 RepID=A0A6B9L9G0_9CAUD|nr:membrane protein [Mycobacterium phage Onyinye]QHB37413.1 membrane protein [Mycobacterium phage Onyinye]UOW92884.1 hypothetical protein SEA_LEOPARD_6 [Mycobacterium phage Leopard]WKW85167.1 membrane protein [Mycobacterium phage Aikoy]